MNQKLKCIEWFCGIGGFAAALSDRVEIVAAIDINQKALEVYQTNFDHPTFCKTIESIDHEISQWNAESWWMSPPCQPFTSRGKQLDSDDPRCLAIKHLIDLIPICLPRWIGLENVPPFRESEIYQQLVCQLSDCGYRWRETCLCPTRIGIPNRRERFYMEIVRESEGPISPFQIEMRVPSELDRFLEQYDDQLAIDPRLAQKYDGAIDIVETGSGRVAACFTSAYGRSPVRSGSYLKVGNQLRRFRPREIANLLGFNSTYKLPDWPNEKLWPLVGNSVSLFALRELFETSELLPGNMRDSSEQNNDAFDSRPL